MDIKQENDKLVQYYNSKRFILQPGEKYFKSHKTWMHRYVFEHHNNCKIAKGFHVHHIDHNKWNNTPGNLGLMPAGEHFKHHYKDGSYDHIIRKFTKEGQKKAIEWHKSEEGREWHREHAKETGFGIFDLDEKECEECGCVYKPKKHKQRHCSNNCKSRARNNSGIDNETRVCVVCGSDFSVNKYAKTKTCSRACSGILRRV